VKHPVTPDGRYFAVRGRLWRMANPGLDEAERVHLVGRLMAARLAVRDAKKRADRGAEAAGKAKIATMGVLCGGFTESSLRQAGCVEIYPGPATVFARFADSLLAR
jgi:hypothetical protein